MNIHSTLCPFGHLTNWNCKHFQDNEKKSTLEQNQEIVMFNLCFHVKYKCIIAFYTKKRAEGESFQKM